MPLDAETIAVLTEQRHILRNEDKVTILLSIDPAELPWEERRRAFKLGQHLKPAKGTNSDDSESEEIDNGKGSSRKRKRGNKSHAMSRFTNLQHLHLSTTFQRFFDSAGVDPIEFLNDGEALEHRIQEFRTKATLGDAFRACYQYAMDLQERSDMDTVRWHFSMIFYHDLNKLINPKNSGRRMGRMMKKKMVRFLEAVFNGNTEKIDEAMLKMDEWGKLGKKLVQLCESFTPGCLFYLAQHLSKNFLAEKYTETGPYHKQAFARLRELGLKELASGSVAEEIGKSIREHLIQPFRDHLNAQREEKEDMQDEGRDEDIEEAEEDEDAEEEDEEDE